VVCLAVLYWLNGGSRSLGIGRQVVVGPPFPVGGLL